MLDWPSRWIDRDAMARWEFAVQLDHESGVPLFRQLASAVMEDIRRGRLRPGDALPGSRTLARTVGVNRQTVVTALDELMAEGWVVSTPARGTFVSPELPESPSASSRRAPARGGISDRTPFELPDAPPGTMPYDVPRGGLLLAPSRSDVRLIPYGLIGRAYGRAVRRSGQILLGYGRPQGHQPLRVAIARMLSATRGLVASADDVCITRGSQMGIALLARTLIRPGDLVVVEELAHQPAVEAFRAQGAQIVAAPLDEAGLSVDFVERMVGARTIGAVYLTPHHQYPTTVMLSASRRLRLLELARTHRFAVIEDDYDHEFHYEGSAVLPLASIDRSGVVAYVGSFSKMLAPGLRIGFIVAPRPVVNAAAAHRLYLDVQGDRVLEHALAELIEEGEVQRHVRRVLREYTARREVLVQALRKSLGTALTFQVPVGGIGLWATVAPELDIDVWADRARTQGVVIATGRRFAVDLKPRPNTRLGFASLNQQELVEAVRRLAAARPKSRAGRR